MRVYGRTDETAENEGEGKTVLVEAGTCDDELERRRRRNNLEGEEYTATTAAAARPTYFHAYLRNHVNHDQVRPQRNYN